ncbi:MAG: nucleotidyltransferase family protein [bacterium]|nr:nucleotidyltransferase family protein [bacterium]
MHNKINDEETFEEINLAQLCEKYPIRKLSLFGSVLRDDFRSDSDIDILIEFEPNAEVTLFDMGGIQVELSEMFGREVDLKTSAFLSPHFRDDVLSKARVIYERG